MGRMTLSILCLGCVSTAFAGGAGVPLHLNHQGVVAVNGVRFTGQGSFRFALVNPANGSNFWTNDGTRIGEQDQQPDTAVTLTVINGIYNVRLGDGGMAAIDAAIFDTPDVSLRIWFDDGRGNGTHQLSPDQRIASAAFAVHSATVDDNAITSVKIADGEVGNVDLADGAVTSGKIADGAVANADLADGAVNGVKIEDETVTAADLAVNSVGGDEIVNDAVTSAKIANGEVGTADLANDSVTSAKIQDGSVTVADLAPNSVDGAEIVNNAVTSTKIASDAASLNRVSGGTMSSVGGNVGIGTNAPEAKLDVDGEIKGFGVVPIGSIIAWHKNPNPNDPDAVLPPPDGWLECNGQVLPLDSPLRDTGATNVPRLNQSDDGYSGGRFLRGGTTSGTPQDATMVADNPKVGIHAFPGTVRNPDNIPTVPVPPPFGNVGVIQQSGLGLQIPFAAVRPRNMSVVWIMRIK